MRRVFGGRDVLWGILSNRLRALPKTTKTRTYCNTIKPNNNSKNGGQHKINEDGSMSHYEAYKQLDNLDFMTAAKIAFSAPKKKFGCEEYLAGEMFCGAFYQTGTLPQSTETRTFCNTIKPNNHNKNGGQHKTNDDGSMSHYEAYKQLDNLDYMTAAKIAFSAPKKKFGLDFHLVQLFFVCLPSLAVYLTAQYARYEIRRMEGELEVKKKAEEEAKAKELLLKAAEEQESSDPELREVKARLGKLEEAIKEIAVIGSRKQPDSTVTQKQDGDGTKQPAAIAPAASTSAPEDQTKKEVKQGSGQQERSASVAITDASQQKQEATQDKGPKDR